MYYWSVMTINASATKCMFVHLTYIIQSQICSHWKHVIIKKKYNHNLYIISKLCLREDCWAEVIVIQILLFQRENKVILMLYWLLIFKLCVDVGRWIMYDIMTDIQRMGGCSLSLSNSLSLSPVITVCYF